MARSWQEVALTQMHRMPERGLAQLGSVMQIAFVPADVQGALTFWTRTMGVGPFFVIEHVQLDDVRYLGQPAEIDFSIMLAYWGELQIEIIQQHNDVPSIYRAWRDAGQQGVHHSCILVDDMAEARAAVGRHHLPIVQEGLIPGGGAAIYVDCGGGPGTMLEVLQPAPGGREFFAALRAAASEWDGTDPVRRVG